MAEKKVVKAKITAKKSVTTKKVATTKKSVVAEVAKPKKSVAAEATTKAKPAPVAKRPTPVKSATKKPVVKKAVATTAVKRAAVKATAGATPKTSVKKSTKKGTSQKKSAVSTKAPIRSRVKSQAKTAARPSFRAQVKAPVKKSVKPEVPALETPMAQVPSSSGKPRFGKADLEKFKERLLAMRERMTGQSGSLRESALERNDEVNPEEDGTDAFMRQQTLKQVSTHNRNIADIDGALRSIEDGTYGICEICGVLIGKGRLEVQPFAPNCIKCQSELEKMTHGRRR